MVFLPIVFLAYWVIFKDNHRYQNILILIASYFFYGWWDYRFLLLIFFSSLIDFFVGLKLQTTNYKKLYLFISLTINIGLLGIFKYYNFFLESFYHILERTGYQINSFDTINIILPVGISFYTFQTMSYSIDIYRGNLKPTKSLLNFMAFVSFFPQLVAGPIERASNLLPQIEKSRSFCPSTVRKGAKLILYGLFKKIVIADSLSSYSNYVFENYVQLDSISLLIGAIAFAFQIYCDFSGYSDIGIGTSKLFGVELKSNFKFPYFARNIPDFWKRWHISLSSWFRDYLYFPLGGSRNGIIRSLINVMIIFLISGLWHGANWTFVIWGLYHAILYIPSFISKKILSKNFIKKQSYSITKSIMTTLLTFCLTTIGWIFFRSNTVNDAFAYVVSLFLNDTSIDYSPYMFYPFIYIVVILLMDYFWTLDERNVFELKFRNRYVKYVFYQFIIWTVIVFFTVNTQSNFIYFQF